MIGLTLFPRFSLSPCDSFILNKKYVLRWFNETAKFLKIV
jgi:hypothetical protein